jgi:ABC-type branched-subunit amino acid transport system substrate-binding protein
MKRSFLLLVMVMLPACASPQPVCSVMTDLTGSQSDFGSALQAGARVALAAGSSVEPLQARVRDAGSDPSRALELSQSEAASALVGIGFTDSDEALAGVPAFVRRSKPFMIVGATDPDLPARCGPGVTRKLSEFFRASALRRGGSITQVIDRRAPDAASRIAGLAADARDLDFVFISAEPDGLSEVLEMIRKALPNTPIVGGDGLDCDAVLRSGDSPSERIFFTTHAWFAEGASPEARKFADAYRALHGKPPSNGFAALGHDAMAVVRAAYERSGSRTPSAIRDEIARTRDFQGASGTISYDAGPVPRKDVWIVEVRQGTRRLAERTPAAEIVTR